MELSVAQQLHQLFISCGFGFILGAYYDIYRVIRIVLHSRKVSVFVQDMVFFLTSAIFTFLFSLAVMDGQLRFYLFLGEGIGFFAYYLTIGRVVVRFAGVVTAAVVCVWRWFWRLIFTPFRVIGRLLKRPVASFYEIVKKIMQKGLTNLKKALKEVPTLLYNQKQSAQADRSRLHRRDKKKNEGR